MRWRWAKWVPLLISGMILLAFGATLFRTIGGPTPSAEWRWMLNRGQFVLHRDPANRFLPRGYVQSLPTEDVLDLGFAWRSSGPDRLWIEFPLWCCALLFASIPAAYLGLNLWLDLERIPGHCPHCHYDLTGNRSGRCPECGNALSRRHRRLARQKSLGRP